MVFSCKQEISTTLNIIITVNLLKNIYYKIDDYSRKNYMIVKKSFENFKRLHGTGVPTQAPIFNRLGSKIRN
ncbi:hypothetical protein CEQ90_20180, partial [Lewinellaceae bacterium SD302]